MIYLKSYKVFESSSVYARSYDRDEFITAIYDRKKGDLKDITLEKRIPYFSINDLSWSSGNGNHHYVVLYSDETIIGICKIGHYSAEERGDDPNYMSVSYCSIDRNYREMGYLKIMIEELMRLCKSKGFDLGASSWTVAGNTKLRPLLKRMADKYDVEFIDHDRMFDREWMYNADMISIEEMSPEEREEHNRLRRLKPETNLFKKLFYDTGKYEIYATQTFYDKEKIDKIYKDIDNGKYDFRQDRGKIAGYFYNGKYYITEGHHRMMAALKYWKKRYDYLPVDKLIKLGSFENKKPQNVSKFPSRMMEKKTNKPRKNSKKRWSIKYKKSINCNNPKGFSQKQFCKRKKRGGSYKS